MANIHSDEARPPAVDEGIFYNIVSLWYMVSRLHTISSKILYGRKNYNTIEKKILYGKNFFTITIRNNNCKNFLPYYHTIFIAAISCRPLVEWKKNEIKRGCLHNVVYSFIIEFHHKSIYDLLDLFYNKSKNTEAK